MADKIEELTLEEFEALPDTKEAGAKIDYPAVLEEIVNRPITIGSLQKIMLKHSHNKPKVYYSEATGWLDRLSTREQWDVKFGYGDRKYVLVTRIVKAPVEKTAPEKDAVESAES